MTQVQEYDVVVIGGGAAGLSAALVLGRARRSVLVVDAGEPRNGPAHEVHGLLGRDGVPPGELLATGREEVARYGGELRTGEVTAATRDPQGFAVALADGATVRARRLVLATGLVDELPEVEGLRARWGRDVVHCPYCHGWEVRDQRLGVLASGPMWAHQVLLFRQWTADVTLLTNATAEPTAEQAEQLAARGVRVVDGEVAAVEVTDDVLRGVRLRDGERVPLDALVVGPRMQIRTPLIDELGLTAVDHPSGMGQHVATDATGRTDVPGIWAAGNVTDLAAQVGAAAAQGAWAAAQINADLLAEQDAAALAAYRVRSRSVPA